MSRIKFMNTEVDDLTLNEAVSEIDRLIYKNSSAYVVTPMLITLFSLKMDEYGT